MTSWPHETVLRDESVTALSPREGDVLVDCTLGCGGHSERGLSVNWEASSHLGRAFSTPDGVTPTW